MALKQTNTELLAEQVINLPEIELTELFERIADHIRKNDYEKIIQAAIEFDDSSVVDDLQEQIYDLENENKTLTSANELLEDKLDQLKKVLK